MDFERAMERFRREETAILRDEFEGIEKALYDERDTGTQYLDDDTRRKQARREGIVHNVSASEWQKENSSFLLMRVVGKHLGRPIDMSSKEARGATVASSFRHEGPTTKKRMKEGMVMTMTTHPYGLEGKYCSDIPPRETDHPGKNSTYGGDRRHHVVHCESSPDDGSEWKQSNTRTLRLLASGLPTRTLLIHPEMPNATEAVNT